MSESTKSTGTPASTVTGKSGGAAKPADGKLTPAVAGRTSNIGSNPSAPTTAGPGNSGARPGGPDTAGTSGAPGQGNRTDWSSQGNMANVGNADNLSASQVSNSSNQGASNANQGNVASDPGNPSYARGVTAVADPKFPGTPAYPVNDRTNPHDPRNVPQDVAGYPQVGPSDALAPQGNQRRVGMNNPTNVAANDPRPAVPNYLTELPQATLATYLQRQNDFNNSRRTAINAVAADLRKINELVATLLNSLGPVSRLDREGILAIEGQAKAAAIKVDVLASLQPPRLPTA